MFLPLKMNQVVAVLKKLNVFLQATWKLGKKEQF